MSATRSSSCCFGVGGQDVPVEAERNHDFLHRLVVVDVGDHLAQFADIVRVPIGLRVGGFGLGISSIGLLAGLIRTIESIAGALIGRYRTFIRRAETGVGVLELLFLLVDFLYPADSPWPATCPPGP